MNTFFFKPPNGFSLFMFLTHQKFSIKLSNSKHRLVGNLKQLIAYVGIARAIAVKRISFPPWEISFPFHVCRHCHTLAFIFENTLFLDLLVIGGRPKYFSYWWDPLVPQNVEFHHSPFHIHCGWTPFEFCLYLLVAPMPLNRCGESQGAFQNQIC